jgi:hypothetical protein
MLFMNTQLTLFLLITLIGCKSNSHDKNIENTSTDNSKIQNLTQLDDTTEFKFDTLKINKQKFVQIVKDGQFTCLLSIQGDTVVKSGNYYSNADLVDIDEDGYQDIRVYAFSNLPNQCENYLFDKIAKVFKIIENCDLDIKRLKGTDFFYSYNRAGCADLNWESHLGKIENYKLVNYGYINGKGCDFNVKDNLQVIEIYRVTNSETGKKNLVTSLPYLKNIPEPKEKLSFIEKYWMKNFKKFNYQK